LQVVFFIFVFEAAELLAANYFFLFAQEGTFLLLRDFPLLFFFKCNFLLFQLGFSVDNLILVIMLAYHTIIFIAF